jgi:small basic protein
VIAVVVVVVVAVVISVVVPEKFKARFPIHTVLFCCLCIFGPCRSILLLPKVVSLQHKLPELLQLLR